MINANPSVANTPVSGARPVTVDPDAPRMTDSLAHGVLVSEKLDHSMMLMLHQMSVGGFNPSPADVLRLLALTAQLSIETKVVGGSIPSYYGPMREVAGKMS
jgi:hypothetical protein